MKTRLARPLKHDRPTPDGLWAEQLHCVRLDLHLRLALARQHDFPEDVALRVKVSD